MSRRRSHASIHITARLAAAAGAVVSKSGVEHPNERPLLTVTEVLRLADSIEPRYRALLLLAVFGSLRWGELIGLRRSDLDLEDSVVRVKRRCHRRGCPTCFAGEEASALKRPFVSWPTQPVESCRDISRDGRWLVLVSRGASLRRDWAHGDVSLRQRRCGQPAEPGRCHPMA